MKKLIIALTLAGFAFGAAAPAALAADPKCKKGEKYDKKAKKCVAAKKK
ncbi:MAG: hypothetical protein KDJ41_09880 [Hyphomicrobiaceae bacterium]|nr:hypothetical protein [Hyphomicrobiaceae bacterium]